MIHVVKIVILFLLIPIHSSLAQVVFVDSDSRLPIPSANVYNINGNLIGFSNKDGMMELIPEMKNAEIIYPLEITVQHVSYESKSLKVTKDGNEQIVLLTPRINQLKEVVISKPTAEFLCIRGYFRSLETFNLKHKYFSDGIVEFYVPLKKGNVKYRLIDYRVYRDSAVVNDYNKKMWTFFQTPRMAEIFAGKLMDRMAGYTLQKVTDKNFKILKKGEEAGHIVSPKGSESVGFYIDNVLPDSVKLEKVFSIEAKIRHDVYIENYSQRPIEDLSPNDLLNVYQLATGSIKRKAAYGHIPYEVINEFYVMDRQFLSSKEYKNVEPQLIKNFYKTSDKSRFSRPFWEDLDSYNISPINNGLAAQLDQNLKLVK